MKTPSLILIGFAILFGLWVAWGYFSVANIESLEYEVLDDSKEYEIRQLANYIVAEANATGDYEDALNSGFMKVADYIFGNNTTSEEVAMTTPVIERSEEIAMTTPVIESASLDDRTIAFVMPAQYNLETLPTPNNDEVTLREVTGERIAVLTFSGWTSEEKVEQKKQELLEYLERDGLEVQETRYAYYNPPWTPPFMRRNEVWAILENHQTVQEELAEIPETAQIATLAGGCFWCIENVFDNQPGVYEAVSGYAGGSEEDADYTTVASGKTDHREAIQVHYDPTVITYDEILDIFWNQIDPTDPDGQYVDRGFHYTTAIYTHNDEQATLAEASRAALEASGEHDQPIVTEIVPFEDNFYLAEEEHQDYAQKRPSHYQRYKDGSGR